MPDFLDLIKLQVSNYSDPHLTTIKQFLWNIPIIRAVGNKGLLNDLILKVKLKTYFEGDCVLDKSESVGAIEVVWSGKVEARASDGLR